MLLENSWSSRTKLFGKLQMKGFFSKKKQLSFCTSTDSLVFFCCRGASIVLDDGTDVGYVRPGTKCGQNKVCSINNQCLDIRTDSNYFICPGHDKVKGHFCSNHGVNWLNTYFESSDIYIRKVSYCNKMRLQ